MASSVLLVGGASSSGKSTLTNFIAGELCKNGYTKVSMQPTGLQGTDWLYRLVGMDKNGNQVKIIVNTASDNAPSIKKLNKFLAKNSCDIISSAIRATGNERSDLLSVIHRHIGTTSYQIEIPLAKMVRTQFNLANVLPWYEKGMKSLGKNNLRN